MPLKEFRYFVSGSYSTLHVQVDHELKFNCIITWDRESIDGLKEKITSKLNEEVEGDVYCIKIQNLTEIGYPENEKT